MSMSAPTSPDDRAVGPPERLHPLFLIKGIAQVAAQPWRRLCADRLSRRVGPRGPARSSPRPRCLAALQSVGTIFYWAPLPASASGMTKSGSTAAVLSRRHRSIPFDRIQDVDIVQGPLGACSA